jgi:hypothetical protein
MKTEQLGGIDMASWNRQTWVGRGRNPEAGEREAYDHAVLRLIDANPPTLADEAADEALQDAGPDDSGQEIVVAALAIEAAS